MIVGYTDPIIGGSCPKYNFCRDKSFVAADKTYLLSRQKYACRDKTFVPTKLCLSRQQTYFVARNTCLSRQNFCRDKNDACGSSRQRYPRVPMNIHIHTKFHVTNRFSGSNRRGQIMEQLWHRPTGVCSSFIYNIVLESQSVLNISCRRPGRLWAHYKCTLFSITKALRQPDLRCSVMRSRKLQALLYDNLPLEEGAGKRCSECVADVVVSLPI